MRLVWFCVRRPLLAYRFHRAVTAPWPTHATYRQGNDAQGGAMTNQGNDA